ncbi:MAG: hypothetical protein HUJ75_03525, partial [Parasporobacterium sp.]|nr:hypothetical protein [Parasporobacterium sp.]
TKMGEENLLPEDVESFVFKPAEKGSFYKKTGPEIVEMIPADEQRTIVTPMWGKLYRRGFLEGMDLLKYKETCPTIFFEDVLMTPIIYSQARNIVIIENTYYIHREVASSISRSGKLSDFYYEQIYSGEILLTHCREMGLEKMYKHELNIHIKTLLRIWVLIDLYKMADEKRKRLKDDIVKSFEKYKDEYMTLCDDSFVKKQIVKAFGGNRKLWTAVMRKTVYRQDVLVASNI